MAKMLQRLVNWTQTVGPGRPTSEQHHRFITSLYRNLLGRDPDPQALRDCLQALDSGSLTMPELLDAMAGSEECQARSQRLAAINRLEDDSLLDESVVFVPKAVVESLFEKTAHFWRTTASDPSLIYFSVVTFEQYRGILPQEARRTFIETGAPYAQRLREAYAKHGTTPCDEAHALDFGCGVGRLAINAAQQFKSVAAVDFSKDHLSEAAANSKEIGVNDRITFHLIQDLESIDSLPKADLIYSLITLQHNTPPVIAYIVGRLLSLLRPKGVAFLHIPLATVGYSFNPTTYLADPRAGSQMEMHVLPKSHLNKIASLHGSEVVESYCIGETGATYSEEIVFRKLEGAN